MSGVQLEVVTVNRGDHADYDAIRAAIGIHAAACLQEMHSVPGLADRLRADGLRVWEGNREDSQSDPVVWDPRQINVDDRYCFPLLPAGVRAGTPNMAKSWNGIGGTHLASGRRVVIGSCHNIQTQGPDPRAAAALRFTRELHRHLEGFGCVVLTGADWNAAPHAASLHPFVSDPAWDLDQLHDPVTTHGKSWCPDGWIYRDRPESKPQILHFVSHRAVAVKGTDHKGLSARFTLDARRAHA